MIDFEKIIPELLERIEELELNMSVILKARELNTLGECIHR